MGASSLLQPPRSIILRISLWPGRAGIADLRKRLARLEAEERILGKRLAKVKPRTPAGAGAMISYILADAEDCSLEN
jgi:hypothetical protein